MGLHRTMLFIFLVITANILDYTYLKYSFSIFFFSSFTMTFINIIQFTVALFIDSRYEKKNIVGLIFLSWYPTLYWVINAAVVIMAFPKALKERKVAMLHGQAQTEAISNGNLLFEYS